MLNEILDLKSGINLVYGEGATGKTTLALMLARDYSKFSKVIFIDTENGFNFERFKQISGEFYESCLKNILFFKIKNFDEQINAIKNLEDIKKINLIIIDSIGVYYRLESKGDLKYYNNKFIEMFQILKSLNKKGINIFLTNQVYRSFESNKLENVGGKIVTNSVKMIIKLENNPRKIINENSNLKYSFEIKEEGIVIR